MRLRIVLLVSLLSLAGCDLAIKNGVFACGQPSDCPSGYFCWGSDNRCYDSKEPECEPKSCDQVIAEFASLGIPIECGSLPDGCEGSIECGGCPDGSVCGANGQNFQCGCEENSCATFEAECGVVPTRCGGEEEAIFCGSCLGDQLVCVNNECVCPPGTDCNDQCDGRCTGEEICVNGACCTPTYPCTQNECSPPGGLPDGCGGVAECPPCQNGDECVIGDNLLFECVDDCTCDAQGIECGNASVCGSPTLCGSCSDNGFGDGYRCKDGLCICEDQYEYNDDFQSFQLICGGNTGVNCNQEAWSVDIQASLHDNNDVDYYALQVLDARTPITAQLYDGLSDRILHMTYLCPNGFEGVIGCTGWVEFEQGILFCGSDDGFLGIDRACDVSTSSEPGTLLVGVRADKFQGDCDEYGLRILATYEAPIF